MLTCGQILRATVILLMLSISSACPKVNAASREPGDRPNFIIIFTDDQGYNDLGCFDSPDIKTPHIDRMAKEGMVFTDFYVACSVCSPSRAALLTGCHPKRVGYPGTINWPKGSSRDTRTELNPDEITIAELLKTEGYHTACVGKWHLGDYEPFLPTRQGFDYYYGIPYSNDMTDPPLPLMRNEEVVEQPTDNALLTQKMTQEAVQYIYDHNDVPFFLYLAHPAPHHPPPASRDFQGTSAGGTYGDSVEELDWSTGEILRTVRDLGLADNTLIVYTSDNGLWLDAGRIGGSAYPLRDGKSSAYEGGLRVPCVMWWPGTIPAGSVCSEVATTMDFYVTFPTMLAIELPQDRVIDGKDILPLLLGEEGATSPYEYFLCYGESLNTGPKAVAIRHGKWKYFYGTGRSHQLYDLSQDVGESTNVSLYHGALCDTLRATLLERDNEVEANSRPIGEWSEPPDDAHVTPSVETTGLLIDFGPDDSVNGTTTPSPDANENYWNNVTEEAAGDDPVYLVDNTGNTTDIYLVVRSTFLGNGILDGGLLAPDAALLGEFAVSTATQDHFYQTHSGSLVIGGLDRSTGYVFKFFGTRSSQEERITRYKLQGSNTATLTLQTSGTDLGGPGYNGNTQKTAVSDPIKPDRYGDISITVSAASGSFCYLGIMKIEPQVTD